MVMKKGRIIFIMLLLIFSIFPSFCFSLDSNLSFEEHLMASISNPKMVLYKNITGDVLEFQNSVIINNENKEDIKVTITPMGDWKDKVSLEEFIYKLKPDERKEIFYNILIDKEGLYAGDILVKFEKENYPNQVSLAQRLVVHVNQDNLNNNITGNSIKILDKTFFVYVGIIIVFILLIIFLILKKINKRTKN